MKLKTVSPLQHLCMTDAPEVMVLSAFYSAAPVIVND